MKYWNDYFQKSFIISALFNFTKINKQDKNLDENSTFY